MANVEDLVTCASDHFAHYTDPSSRRAFFVYDRMGDPDRLEPTDLLAPALLDAPVSGQDVIAMYLADGPQVRLREALEAVILDRDAVTARFVDQDLDAETGPWALVKLALLASTPSRGVRTGFRAAKVTKILHRKRPQLVPIFDSKVAGFYGVSSGRPWELWPLLQAELRTHGDWLRDLGVGRLTLEGRPLSELRVLDIVVWEHMQSCGQTAG